jgi:hypothetical protein
MKRRVDREIQAWRRRPARDQLRLLWEEESRDGVQVIAYWDAGAWSSAYVISGIEPNRLGGTLRALTEIHFGERKRDATFLTGQDLEGPPPEVLNLDPGEARFRLGKPGASEREELCDWLISVGRRRDEIDIPLMREYAGHEDEVVRFTVLGMLSWNPSVGNDQLIRWFGKDDDPRISELARKLGGGLAARYTRPL